MTEETVKKENKGGRKVTTLILSWLTAALVWLGLSVAFAEGCAWTAVYVYRIEEFNRKRKVFHVGVDPTFAPSQYMRVFGSVGGYEWAFRLNNPVPYSHAVRRAGMMPAHLAFCRLQSGLDRRYGWMSRNGGAR